MAEDNTEPSATASTAAAPTPTGDTTPDPNGQVSTASAASSEPAPESMVEAKTNNTPGLVNPEPPKVVAAPAPPAGAKKIKVFNASSQVMSIPLKSGGELLILPRKSREVVEDSLSGHFTTLKNRGMVRTLKTS